MNPQDKKQITEKLKNKVDSETVDLVIEETEKMFNQSRSDDTAITRMNELISQGDWEPWYRDVDLPFGYEPPYMSFGEHYERKLGYVRESSFYSTMKGFYRWVNNEVETVEADNSAQLITHILETIYERPE